MQKYIAIDIPTATLIPAGTNTLSVTARHYPSHADTPSQRAETHYDCAYTDYKNNCIRKDLPSTQHTNIPRRLLEKLETTASAFLALIPSEDPKREIIRARLTACQHHAFETFRVLTPTQLALCFQKQLSNANDLSSERIPDSDIPSFMISEYISAAHTAPQPHGYPKDLVKIHQQNAASELIYCIGNAYQQTFLDETMHPQHITLTTNTEPNRYKTQHRKIIALLTRAIKNNQVQENTHYLKETFPELKKALRPPLFAGFFS